MRFRPRRVDYDSLASEAIAEERQRLLGQCATLPNPIPQRSKQEGMGGSRNGRLERKSYGPSSLIGLIMGQHYLDEQRQLFQLMQRDSGGDSDVRECHTSEAQQGSDAEKYGGIKDDETCSHGDSGDIECFPGKVSRSDTFELLPVVLLSWERSARPISIQAALDDFKKHCWSLPNDRCIAIDAITHCSLRTDVQVDANSSIVNFSGGMFEKTMVSILLANSGFIPIFQDNDVLRKKGGLSLLECQKNELEAESDEVWSQMILNSLSPPPTTIALLPTLDSSLFVTPVMDRGHLRRRGNRYKNQNEKADHGGTVKDFPSQIEKSYNLMSSCPIARSFIASINSRESSTFDMISSSCTHSRLGQGRIPVESCMTDNHTRSWGSSVQDFIGKAMSKLIAEVRPQPQNLDWLLRDPKSFDSWLRGRKVEWRRLRRLIQSRNIVSSDKWCTSMQRCAATLDSELTSREDQLRNCRNATTVVTLSSKVTSVLSRKYLPEHETASFPCRRPPIKSAKSGYCGPLPLCIESRILSDLIMVERSSLPRNLTQLPLSFKLDAKLKSDYTERQHHSSFQLDISKANDMDGTKFCWLPASIRSVDAVPQSLLERKKSLIDVHKLTTYITGATKLVTKAMFGGSPRLLMCCDGTLENGKDAIGENIEPIRLPQKSVEKVMRLGEIIGLNKLATGLFLSNNTCRVDKRKEQRLGNFFVPHHKVVKSTENGRNRQENPKMQTSIKSRASRPETLAPCTSLVVRLLNLTTTKNGPCMEPELVCHPAVSHSNSLVLQDRENRIVVLSGRKRRRKWVPCNDLQALNPIPNVLPCHKSPTSLFFTESSTMDNVKKTWDLNSRQPSTWTNEGAQVRNVDLQACDAVDVRGELLHLLTKSSRAAFEESKCLSQIRVDETHCDRRQSTNRTDLPSIVVDHLCMENIQHSERRENPTKLTAVRLDECTNGDDHVSERGLIEYFCCGSKSAPKTSLTRKREKKRKRNEKKDRRRRKRSKRTAEIFLESQEQCGEILKNTASSNLSSLAAPEVLKQVTLLSNSPASFFTCSNVCDLQKSRQDNCYGLLRSDIATSLLCSEAFLENFGETVSQLASGQWIKCYKTQSIDSLGERMTHNFPSGIDVGRRSESSGRQIMLYDCPLIDKMGIDIEFPNQVGAIIIRLSSWSHRSPSQEEEGGDFSGTRQNAAKSFVRKCVKLAASGRYLRLHILLCVDVPITAELSSEVSMLKNAVIGQPSCPCELANVEHVSLGNLSACIAEYLPRATLRKYNGGGKQQDRSDTSDWLEMCSSDRDVQEVATLLLDFAPSLSVLASLECIRLYSVKHTDSHAAFKALMRDASFQDCHELYATLCEKGAMHLSKESVFHLSLAIAANIAMAY